MTEKAEYNRLYWHSRRGMLELDLILVPFLETQYENLEEQLQADFKRLLLCEDQDMWRWFMGMDVPPDKELVQIVKLIIAFARTPKDKA